MGVVVNFFKKKMSIIFPMMLLFLIFPDIILNIDSVTFNFADNRSYLYGVVKLRNNFFSPFSSLPTIPSPLLQYPLSFFGYWFSEAVIFNILYLGGFVIAWHGSYKLFYKIGDNKIASMLGATLFSFNSLSIYANRFNLTGFIWIPFVINFLIFEKNNFKLFVYSIFMGLSGHYLLLLLICVYFVAILCNLNLKFLRKKSGIFLAIVISLLVYLVGILNTTGISGTLEKSSNNELGDVGIDLVRLLKPNSDNFITDVYEGNIYAGELGKYRYSFYLGIFSLILLLLSFVNYQNNRNTRFFLFLLIFSFIFFLGGKLIIGGYTITEYMPFDLFRFLGVGGIVRKSAYFYYLFIFAVGGIVSLTLNTKNKIPIILALIICLGIVLENNYSFSRQTHTIDTYNFSSLGDNNFGKVLALPNTGYSINKFGYYLGKEGYSVRNYPDVTIKGSVNNYLSENNYCGLNKLLGLGSRNCSTSPYDTIQTMKKLGIKDIVLFKDGYIKYFFYEGNSGDGYYKKTLAELDLLTKYTKKTYEDDKIIVFSLFSSSLEPIILSGNKINYRKDRRSVYGLNINQSTKNNIYFDAIYSKNWKLYPGKFIDISTCDNIVNYPSVSNNQLQSYIPDPRSVDRELISHTIQEGETADMIIDLYDINPETIYIRNRELENLFEPGEDIQISIPLDESDKNVDDSNIVSRGETTECMQNEYSFFEGEELSYLRKQPLRDETHEMVYDYANGRTIDLEMTHPGSQETYREVGLREGRVTLADDGTYDIHLTMYFRPQSRFYLGLIVSGSLVFCFLMRIGMLRYNLYIRKDHDEIGV